MPTTRGRVPAVTTLLLLAAAAPATGPSAAPATFPSTAPSVAPSSRPSEPVDPRVDRRFADLADPDPAVRADAREWLMGRPAADLPALLAAVRGADPLRPDQAAVLHDIVCQVFLAGDPYVAIGGPGDPDGPRPPEYVMGVRWTSPGGYAPRLGVPVDERWAGFPARRLLRDGDMILGVYLDPDARPDQDPDVVTHEVQDVIAAVRSSPNPSHVTLSVLRDGRPVRLALTLVPKPVETEGTLEQADGFLRKRLAGAEAYWQKTFAPLVDPPDEDAAPPRDPGPVGG